MNLNYIYTTWHIPSYFRSTIKKNQFSLYFLTLNVVFSVYISQTMIQNKIEIKTKTATKFAFCYLKKLVVIIFFNGYHLDIILGVIVCIQAIMQVHKDSRSRGRQMHGQVWPTCSLLKNYNT